MILLKPFSSVDGGSFAPLQPCAQNVTDGGLESEASRIEQTVLFKGGYATIRQLRCQGPVAPGTSSTAHLWAIRGTTLKRERPFSRVPLGSIDSLGKRTLWSRQRQSWGYGLRGHLQGVSPPLPSCHPQDTIWELQRPLEG